MYDIEMFSSALLISYPAFLKEDSLTPLNMDFMNSQLMCAGDIRVLPSIILKIVTPCISVIPKIGHPPIIQVYRHGILFHQRILLPHCNT